MRQSRIDFFWWWPEQGAAHLIANAVDKGLAQVRLKSAFAACLEGLKISQGSYDGLLNEV